MSDNYSPLQMAQFNRSSTLKSPGEKQDASRNQQMYQDNNIPSQEFLDNYFEGHPLKSIDPDNWNNIPICIVKSFKVLVHHCMVRDLDQWEKKAKINDEFFKLQHMFLKIDSRQRQKEEMFNKALDYQQTSLSERIKKLEQNLDTKSINLEDQVKQFKKQISYDIENLQASMKTLREDLIIQSGNLTSLEKQTRLQLENDKVFLNRQIQKSARDIIDNHLIISENEFIGQNMITKNHDMKEYVVEKFKKIKESQIYIQELITNNFEKQIKMDKQEIEKRLEQVLSQLEYVENQLLQKMKSNSNTQEEKWHNNQKIQESLNSLILQQTDQFYSKIDTKFEQLNNQHIISSNSLNNKITILEDLFKSDSARLKEELFSKMPQQQQQLINTKAIQSQFFKVEQHLERELSNVQSKIEILSQKVNSSKQAGKSLSKPTKNLLSEDSSQHPSSPKQQNLNGHHTNQFSSPSSNQQTLSHQETKKSKKKNKSKELINQSHNEILTKEQIENIVIEQINVTFQDNFQRIKLELMDYLNNELKQDLILEKNQYKSGSDSMPGISNQTQSRLFSAAYENRKQGGIFSTKNINSQTTKVASFDNFRQHLGESIKNQKSIKEWNKQFDQHIEKVQINDIQEKQEQNTSRDFLKDCKYEGFTQSNILNYTTLSGEHLESIDDQQNSNLKSTDENQSSLQIQTENLELLSRNGQSIQSIKQPQFIQISEEKKKQNEEDRLKRYEVMVNNFERSSNLRYQPIINAQADAKTSVSNLLQSYNFNLTSPNNHNPMSQQTQRHKIAPIYNSFLEQPQQQVLSLTTFEFKDVNEGKTQRFFEKRTPITPNKITRRKSNNNTALTSTTKSQLKLQKTMKQNMNTILKDPLQVQFQSINL